MFHDIMILSDQEIKEYIKKHRMISPFKMSQVRKGVISYGVSSYGYDFRIANEFKIFTNIRNAIVDPKNFDPKSFINYKGKECIIPPNSFVLAKSLEYFKIPRNVLGICLGKSTYARCGIVVNVTPLEPCYDEKTEILTLEDWKKFYELKENEPVATLNKEGELEYQNILKIHKFRHQGKLISIRGRNIDLAVTPAHLLMVRKKWRKHFEFIPAGKIYKKYNYELKRDAIWKGKKVDYFMLPVLELNERFLPSHNLMKDIMSILDEGVLSTKKLYENCGEGVVPRKFLWTLDKLKDQGFLQREYEREIINRHSIKVCLWKKAIPSTIELSPYSIPVRIPINDWLRFFGIWLAEGSSYVQTANRNYTVKIACFDKKKKKIINGWLKKLPFHFFETESGFSILNKQLCLYLIQFGHSYEKFIPKEIKSLPPQQLKILLEAILMGDGNIETLTYTTSSQKLADDLQEIILKCGWVAIVRRLAKEKFPVRELKGHLVKAKHDIYKIRISKKHLTPKIYKRSFSEIEYNGFVYDVTVPNHTLYVRRQGKACWSSNCWQGFVTVEISNTTPLPAKIYAGEGIAQVIFIRGSKECVTSYADKKGKYQKQRKLTLPKI